MQLFVQKGGNQAFLINFVCSYLKLVERGSVKIISLSEAAIKASDNGQLKISVPSLVPLKGEVITETFKIIKYFFSLQPLWEQFFLGSNEEERLQINNIKNHLKEGKQTRKYLQKHLQNKTFFVANHLTFADIFMFTQLYDNLIEMTDEQKNQYNNLFRWYRHIQNLPQIKQFLAGSNRILVECPQPKLTFLEIKKSKKKGG